MFTFHLHVLIQHILACELSNSNNYHNFPCPTLPTFGILCDGQSFEIFSFDRTTSPPTVSRGTFLVSTPDGPKQSNKLLIAHLDDLSSNTFIRSLRPVCEVLYYIFLQAFKDVVKIHAIREEGSTCWSEAYLNAVQALTYAKTAAKKAAARDPDADKNAQKAAHSLQQRYVMFAMLVLN